MIGSDIDAGEALAELEDILHLAAASQTSLPRGTALRYVSLRDFLLNKAQVPLPGFLRQCLTIDRFREFIHLYHYRAEERDEFIHRSLHATASRPAMRFVRDVFSDTEF